MTVLIPMPAARFPEFVEAAAASHASDNVACGRWSPHEAEALAQAESGGLLPNEYSTPDHCFYEIRIEPDGVAWGFVWLDILPRGGKGHPGDRARRVRQQSCGARLYRSYGYAVISMSMHKELSPGDVA